MDIGPELRVIQVAEEDLLAQSRRATALDPEPSEIETGGRLAPGLPGDGKPGQVVEH